MTTNRQMFVPEVKLDGLEQRSDLLAQIGATPLLRLRRVTEGIAPGVAIYGKAEHLNPGGSLKDRPVLALLRAGEAGGQYPHHRPST